MLAKRECVIKIRKKEKVCDMAFKGKRRRTCGALWAFL